MCTLACRTLERQITCRCSARDSLHLCCGLSGTGERLERFSAYDSCSSAWVSLLVGSSLDADVNVVFAGDEGQLVVADVAVKSFKFRRVAVYVPNATAERVSFFRRLASFLDDSKRLVLMGDWNAILDPNMEKVGWELVGLGRCESNLVDLMARHDLVDWFRQDHPGRKMWT